MCELCIIPDSSLNNLVNVPSKKMNKTIDLVLDFCYNKDVFIFLKTLMGRMFGSTAFRERLSLGIPQYGSRKVVPESLW